MKIEANVTVLSRLEKQEGARKLVAFRLALCMIGWVDGASAFLTIHGT